jgi:L-threonylcarbamoyladenylate synthase
MTNQPPVPIIRSADAAGLSEAARLILLGQPVALPTETVYGLAADATSGGAVAAVYDAKGRPSFNPLIVHVADMAMAETIASFSSLAHILAAHFWPGPLTMVLPIGPDSPIASLVTAGLPTIAIRIPAHPVMQAMIQATGRPLAAPSANASGTISPTRACHVARSLAGRIPLILDGGATQIGLESTIVAVDDDMLRLLRHGPVTARELTAVTGVSVVDLPSGKIEAPGQLASHYAPSKSVRLNAGRGESDEYMIGFGAIAGDISLSETADLREAAAHLFDMLYIADASPKQRIAIAPIPAEGLGFAINDRLNRAAAPR